jgi:hypothetical protein
VKADKKDNETVVFPLENDGFSYISGRKGGDGRFRQGALPFRADFFGKVK